MHILLDNLSWVNVVGTLRNKVFPETSVQIARDSNELRRVKGYFIPGTFDVDVDGVGLVRYIEEAKYLQTIRIDGEIWIVPRSEEKEGLVEHANPITTEEELLNRFDIEKPPSPATLKMDIRPL